MVSELRLPSSASRCLTYLLVTVILLGVGCGTAFAQLSSATLTGILDRIEAAGFIERKNNPDDRRSIHIHLTPKGNELSKEAINVIASANKEFLQVLTKEQRRDLFEIIKKLRLSVSR